MSPLVQSLLSAPQPVVPDCSTEALDLLVDALLCANDLTTLTVDPLVGTGDAGAPNAEVRVHLNGLSWRLTAVQALTASGRLVQSRTPFVPRRQAYRFCADRLASTAQQAAQLALAARYRGAH